jgi:hypothetical protein
VKRNKQQYLDEQKRKQMIEERKAQKKWSNLITVPLFFKPNNNLNCLLAKSSI